MGCLDHLLARVKVAEPEVDPLDLTTCVDTFANDDGVEADPDVFNIIKTNREAGRFKCFNLFSKSPHIRVAG